MFITFEGIDGSGKSTQARLLAESLRDLGHEVVLTREPGGSPGAEEIRALVLRGDPGRWSPETELLLFNAARRDHVERTIQPALSAGKIVICDRFADTTRLYQGATSPEMRESAEIIHKRLIGLEPDLVILIDMDPATALNRGLARKSGEDRFEEMGLAFQQKQRDGYHDLAQASPTRFATFDGGQDMRSLAEQILQHVITKLPPTHSP